MGIGVRHRCGLVAAGLLALAAAFAPPLSAQARARRSKRAPRVAPAPRPRLQRSHVGPARSILHNLVGRWRFEIWFAGNVDGAPDGSGTRVVKALFDDLRLEWTEQLDHSALQGQGVIAFDPASDRFLTASVYSAASAPDFATGVVDDAEPLVTFTPIAIAPGANARQQPMQGSTLSVLDPDHFTWAALDRQWRAVFTREP